MQIDASLPCSHPRAADELKIRNNTELRAAAERRIAGERVEGTDEAGKEEDCRRRKENEDEEKTKRLREGKMLRK